MTSALSAELCQPLLCFILYSKAKLTCYSRYLLTSYFCIPIPYDEKDTFFWCSFQKVLEVFIELLKFSFFGISGWGIDLDYCDVEWFALKTNRDHSVVLEIVPKYCISGSFVDYEGCSISPKGFLPSLLYQNLILMLVLCLQTMFFCLLILKCAV